MHILVSNDDGIMAPGIIALADRLAQKHRVTVVAPEKEQSAKSHALTIHNPVQLIEMNGEGANPRRYALTGTPTDCVKFALSYLLKDDKPDLVVSGINNGFNLGSDALYSGTVGAGMEGLFFGVPGLAVSVEKFSEERGKEIIPFVCDFIEEVFEHQDYYGMLNMNFPLTGCCDWEHCDVVNQGLMPYDGIVRREELPDGRVQYHIGGSLVFKGEDRPTDVTSIKEGRITVVALGWQQQDQGGTEIVSTMVIAKKKA